MTFQEAVSIAHQRLGFSEQQIRDNHRKIVALYPGPNPLGAMTIPAGKEEQIIASMITLFVQAVVDPTHPALKPLHLDELRKRLKHGPTQN
jgi:hypothetical protein